MEEFISRLICSYCYEGKDSDEKEVVLYGIQLLIEGLFKTLLLIMFSSCVGKVTECVQFLFVFCSLRVVAGGAHCRTNLGCTCVFFGIFFEGMFFEKCGISVWVAELFVFVCMGVCLKWAPSTTENNPIIDKSIRRRKKILSVLILIACFVEIKCSIMKFHRGYIVAAVLNVLILIIIQEVHKWKKISLNL